MTEKASRRKATKKVSRKDANAPTGLVTFLFTDIEGSTALWENYPNQMQDALVRHDEILRAAVEAREGFVFKTVGDACYAAFATPRQALEATLAAQRALFAEPWEEDTTLRVRMALHTGVAEERNGDYFGPPVNRVARLLSAGHGGQILLSAVTYGLVRDNLVHLEPEAELRDLGEHRLKDLRYTEHIFQLVVPDLPKDFPPLKTHELITPAQGLPTPILAASSPPAQEEPLRDAAPSRDDRYRRVRPLGSGGMARVYLAHDELLDRDVALKILRKQYAEDQQFVERFEREAKSAAKLSHPNIVAVHDRGETRDGSYYIAMEYVSGGTLKEHIEMERPLRASEAVELTAQIARALQAAHRREVIHRDIKPQNVLLTEWGEAKVADFGIAKAATSTTMTKTGAVMGTAHYVSPEQALGETATFQSDLYSLGVVLYEMLTGKLPHDAETPVGIAMQHISGQLRPPKQINPAVSEEVNEVCLRLLAKDPKARYQSATELIEDLERVRRGEPPAFVAARQENPKAADTLVDEEMGTILDQQNTVADGAGGTVEQYGTPDSSTDRPQDEAAASPAPQGTIPEQEATGPSYAPQGSPSRNKTMLLLVIGAIILLLVLLGGGAVAFLAFGSDRGGKSSDESANVKPPDQPSNSQADANAGKESSKETASPSPGYKLAKDGSGSLTMEVPSGWEYITNEESETQGESGQSTWSSFAGVGIGSSITASSDLDVWNSSTGTGVPGMYAVASRKLAQKYTDDQLVVEGPNDRSRSAECERGSSQNLNRSSYSGKIQVWDCPARGNKPSRTLYAVSAAPQDRACVAVLHILTYSKADRDVAQHILDTFQVDCKGI